MCVAYIVYYISAGSAWVGEQVSVCVCVCISMMCVLGMSLGPGAGLGCNHEYGFCSG